MERIKKFVKAMLIRAVKTFAQSALAVLPTSTALVGEVNWKVVFSTATLAFIISCITSIAGGLPEVKENKDNE